MAGMVNEKDGSRMWCRNDVLVKKLNCAERTVQRLTKQLVQEGALRKIEQFTDDGRQYNNAYEVLTPGLALPGQLAPGGRVTKPDEEILVTLPLTGMSPSPCQKRHPPKEITKRNNQEKSYGSTTTAARREVVQKPLLLIGEARRPTLASEDLVNALRREIETLRLLTGGGSFEYWCREVTSRKLRDRKRDYTTARTQLDGISEVFAKRSLLDANTEIWRFARIRDWSEDDVAEARRSSEAHEAMRKTG